MLNLAEAVREQIVKETPPRKGDAPKAFTLAKLRRLTVWGMTSAAALLVVVMASRSETGVQRIGLLVHGEQKQARLFDAQAETQRLGEALRSLTADQTQLKSRLNAVEHDMTDVTGSISKEIEATDAVRRAAATAGPTTMTTAAASVALEPAPAPAATFPPAPAPLPVGPAPPSLPATASASDLHMAVLPPGTEYAVDIGSGLTIEALRARWLSIYSAHPMLFGGLKPIVGIKEVAHGSRVELRLLVGPLAQPAAANELCASLSQFGMFCQPTIYDGQRLALR
jgi:hypothetical protein